MRVTITLTALALGACSVAHAEGPTTFTLLNRVATAYARLNTYSCKSTLTRKVLGKDETTAVSMAAKRPDRMRIEVKGPRTPVIVTISGATTVACRPNRAVYSRFNATPKQPVPDVLARPDFPAPASRIVALFLRGFGRGPASPLAKALAEATVDGSETAAGVSCWMLKFPYDDYYNATVFVGADDWLIRSVALDKRGTVHVTETIDTLQKDQAVTEADLGYDVPKQARLVVDLPAFARLKTEAPPALADAHDFSLMNTSGDTVTLSKLRDKPVVLVFYLASSEENAQLFPLLVDIHKRNKDRGGEVLAIDGAATSADDTAAFMKGFGATFAGLMNLTNDDAVQFYSVDAFPTIVFVTKDGKVADKVTGYDKKAINAALLKIGLE